MVQKVTSRSLVLFVRSAAALFIVSGVLACGADSGAAAAAQAQQQSRDAANPAARHNGESGGNVNGSGDQQRGGGGGGGAREGGRPIPSITLAPGDVAIVGRETLEEGTPITGDLRPIETVDVRAKLEGDLIGVFVKEGQVVSSGQLLARFEGSEQESARKSAEAERAAAQTELSMAQWTYDQNKELFTAGAIAERDYKVSQQALESARAKLAASDAKLHSSSVASRDTRVLAPTAGVIQTRSVENGERVSRGTSMFTLVRNDVLELAAAVPARQANSVRVGQEVHFAADGKSFDGRVARVSPTIDPASRAITVYVEVPNSKGLLKGGTFATGRVVSRELNNVLTIPQAAIRQSQEGGHPFVYRVDGRTVAIAQVQLGVIDERLGKAEVLDGVAAGDRVIVGNVGTLGRGMQVIMLGNEERRPGQGRAGGQGRGSRGRTGGP